MNQIPLAERMRQRRDTHAGAPAWPSPAPAGDEDPPERFGSSHCLPLWPTV